MGILIGAMVHNHPVENQEQPQPQQQLTLEAAVVVDQVVAGLFASGPGFTLNIDSDSETDESV